MGQADVHPVLDAAERRGGVASVHGWVLQNASSRHDTCGQNGGEREGDWDVSGRRRGGVWGREETCH